MTAINIRERVSTAYTAFRNRREAGVKLSEYMNAVTESATIVLALPRGGVPVARATAEGIGAPLKVVTARKLPIPSSPEMGFGAVAIDGTLVLNERLVAELGLGEDMIDRIAGEVRAEVERRAREYAADSTLPEVQGKTVYLVDDGLATGYSVIAAARMVKSLDPRRVILGVPVSPENSIRTVSPHFDEIYCLIAQEHPPFAVASYYQDFHDMSDREVQDILERVAASRN
jgi:putative phosphoribosyl transferase